MFVDFRNNLALMEFILARKLLNLAFVDKRVEFCGGAMTRGVVDLVGGYFRGGLYARPGFSETAA